MRRSHTQNGPALWLFPLTPALSQRERENRSTVAGQECARDPPDGSLAERRSGGDETGSAIVFQQRRVALPLLRERAGVRGGEAVRLGHQCSPGPSRSISA